MNTADLHYDLPQELIAQQPCAQRDQARMLVVDRAQATFHEDVFANLPRHLRAGDCIALNDTRVIRARLHGRKPTGGRVELFLLKEERPGVWTALVKPSAKVKPGTPVALPEGLQAVVEDVLPEGRRRVQFTAPNVIQQLERAGQIPLPPYIRRDAPEPNDAARYQTVYAQRPGAVAAPTAGLHFTPAVFDALDKAGVAKTSLTLHVGYGTFRPIQAETLEAHRVDPEEFVFPETAAARLNAARRAGGRIVAVGTTVARVLETQFIDDTLQPGAGVTDRYIYPPYAFRAVDALQTNFHLPCSSLLALVCAFAGRDLVMAAYRHAVHARFRFYSYGDVMLIL